jgi:hypothetical protein
MSQDKGATFEKLKIDGGFPFAGIAQTADGTLALVGMEGLKLITNSGAAVPKS